MGKYVQRDILLQKYNSWFWKSKLLIVMWKVYCEIRVIH